MPISISFHLPPNKHTFLPNAERRMPKADTLSSGLLIFSPSYLLSPLSSDLLIFSPSHLLFPRFRVITLNPFDHIGHGPKVRRGNTLLTGIFDDLGT